MTEQNGEWRGKITAEVDHVKDDVEELKKTTRTLRERQAEMWLWFRAVVFVVAALVVGFGKDFLKAFWEN